MVPRLRVLHAIHDFLPRHQAGSEIYAADLARTLQTRGHHVTVLAATYDPARRHGEVIWRVFEGVPVVEIVNNWSFSGFDEAWTSSELGPVLARILEAVDPDVVHVHNLFNLSLELPAMAKARGAAVVATLHDYALVCPSGGQRLHRAERHVCHTIDPGRCARCFRESPFQAQLVFGRALRAPGAGITQRIARLLRRRAPELAARLAAAARRAAGETGPTAEAITRRLERARSAFDAFDYVVAPSNFMAAEFRGLGFPSEKIHVSDYGFAPVTRASRSAESTSNALRVGYVGTLVWHKGVHVLVDAVRRVSAGVELLLYGDTSTFPEYSSALRRAAGGLPIRFMGPFGHDDLAAIYAQIDVLAVPSLWLENSPLVIHEAFMAGVPVVGARIGGIVDLVQDGVNGLLYEPNVPEALAAALGQLATDRALLATLAANVPTVGTIDADAEHWEGVYLAVTAGRTKVGAAS
jgi:glycosyltransferase involved in cell wall biosynthesis